MTVKIHGHLDYSAGAADVVAAIAGVLEDEAEWTNQNVSGRFVFLTKESSEGHQAYVEISVDGSGRISVEVGNEFASGAFVGDTIERHSSASGGAAGNNILFYSDTWFMMVGTVFTASSPDLQDAILGGGVINPVESSDPYNFWALGEYTAAGSLEDRSLYGRNGDLGINLYDEDGTAYAAVFMTPFVEITSSASRIRASYRLSPAISKYVAFPLSDDDERVLKGTIDDMISAFGFETGGANWNFPLFEYDGSVWAIPIRSNGIQNLARSDFGGIAFRLGEIVDAYEFWNVIL